MEFFYMADVNVFYISELHNEYFTLTVRIQRMNE